MNEEVLKYESSTYSFHLVDFRLKKLQEHILNQEKIKNENEHYFSTISKYIDDAIDHQSINYNTIVSLKKILNSIQVFEILN